MFREKVLSASYVLFTRYRNSLSSHIDLSPWICFFFKTYHIWL